jgi:hypothetical protein
VRQDCIFLAKPFINETEGLADRFLMEIGEKVNMQRKAPEDSTGKDIIQGMAECGGEETRNLSILPSCHQPL